MMNFINKIVYSPPVFATIFGFGKAKESKSGGGFMEKVKSAGSSIGKIITAPFRAVTKTVSTTAKIISFILKYGIIIIVVLILLIIIFKILKKKRENSNMKQQEQLMQQQQQLIQQQQMQQQQQQQPTDIQRF